jgi:YfiH family protein
LLSWNIAHNDGMDGLSATIHPPILEWAAWKKYPWLIHGFSTRQGGLSTAYLRDPAAASELNLGLTADDSSANVHANREAFVRAVLQTESDHSSLILLRQIHSANSFCVSSANCVDVVGAEGDGLMTNQPGLLLAIQTADCVPVLIVDAEHKAVAAFHAGWRGTVKRIVEKGIRKMQAEFSSDPRQLSAAIGPCIRGCCYMVGKEVRKEFRDQFTYADELFIDEQSGSADTLSLDLVEANRRQLVDAGLRLENLHEISALSEGCTACHPERFFSYRKDQGRTGRMMSMIGVRQ